MSPRFVLGWENVPCVAEVVNRSVKADCTDFSQCNQHFENDKIVYLQSKGCMATANWPLQSFSYFYLVIVFTAGQYS